MSTGIASPPSINDMAADILSRARSSAPITASRTPVVVREAPQVVRPNGAGYTARLIGADLFDLEMLRRVRDAEPSLPVLFNGPPGTGKTALAEAHAAFCGAPIATVAGHGDIEAASFLGRYVPQADGTFRWIDGPLPRMLRAAGILFVDDVTLIPPSVLACLYPVMDGRGRITLDDHEGEPVEAVSGFQVVAAHNPGVVGAVLTEALSSRFKVQITVTTDYALAVRLGVAPAVVRVAQKMAAQVQDGHAMWAPQMRELLAFQQLAQLISPQIAAANMAACAPPEDQEMLLSHLGKTFQGIAPLALQAS